MKLEVTEEFHDRVEDVIRAAGDILTVSDERGKELLAARVARALPEDEPKPAEPKKPARRKK